MTSTYRLNVNELSMDLISSIRAAFKDKDIEITVTEAIDETDYLLSSEKNKIQLQESVLSLQEGKGVIFTVEELEEKFGKK